MSESELFAAGLRTRREVLGADYVDRSIAGADEFMMSFQRVTTEWCWGYTWNREGLDRRTRSLLNLAMLTALGKPAELRLHVLGVELQDLGALVIDPDHGVEECHSVSSLVMKLGFQPARWAACSRARTARRAGARRSARTRRSTFARSRRLQRGRRSHA